MSAPDQHITFVAGTLPSELTTVQRHYVQHMIQHAQMDQLATFSGSEQDPMATLRWLRDIEDHLYGRFVEPELWVILAAVRLREGARSWFVDEVEEQYIFGDWKRFKTALIDKWSPGHFFKIVSAYHGNNQREEETVDDFFARFKLLRDNLPERDPEAIAKVLFVNGLGEDVREIVLSQFPETVEAAYKTAKMVEVLKATVEASVRASVKAGVSSEGVRQAEFQPEIGSEETTPATADTQTVSIDSENQTDSTDSDNQTASTETDIQITSAEVATASSVQAVDIQSASTSLTPKTPATHAPSERTCYLCNQPGHKAMYCPQSSNCVYCHKDTHVSRLCPDRAYTRYRGGRNSAACFRCHGFGHKARQCTYTFGMTHVRAKVGGGDKKEPSGSEGGPEEHEDHEESDKEAGPIFEAEEQAEVATEAEEESERESDSESESETDKGDLSRLLATGEDTETTPLMKCFRCRELGHLTEECTAPPEKSHLEYTSKDRCLNCKQRGHRVIDCTEPKVEDADGKNDAQSVDSSASDDSVEPEDLSKTEPTVTDDSEVRSPQDLGFASE